jgi:hypothetical protein
MSDEYQTRQFFNMKHSELKQIIKEEVRSVLSEERKIKMSGILKDGKKKLEILKQSMKKDGYDI